MRHAHRSGLVFRPIEGAPQTDLLVAWRPDDGSPIVRDFLDVLGEVGVRGPAATARPTKAKRRTSS